MRDAQALFKRHFSYTPSRVVRVPGRLELLGAQGLCPDGLALTAAVDKYVTIAAAPRTDGKVELAASTVDGIESFWLSDLRSNRAALWADSIKGVLVQLRKRGVSVSGFDAAIHDGIPAGLDLGGPSARVVAAALILRELFPFTLTETGATVPPRRTDKGALPKLSAPESWHFAQLANTAEIEFVGGHGALHDSASSLLAKEWNVMSLDDRVLTVEQLPLVGHVLIIMDRGAHSADGERIREELRLDAESAIRQLRVKSLRSLELKDLPTSQRRLSPREYGCAHHVLGEHARIVAAERALRADDYGQFGQFLIQSGESVKSLYPQPSAELDLLLDLAATHPSCLGARPVGGGMGSTLNLVAHHQAEDFMKVVGAKFGQRTNQPLKPLVCQIVGGATAEV